MKIGKIKFIFVVMVIVSIPVLLFFNNYLKNNFCNINLMIGNHSEQDSIQIEVLWDDIVIADRLFDNKLWYEDFMFNTSWGWHTLKLIINGTTHTETKFVFPMRYFVVEYYGGELRDKPTDDTSDLVCITSNALPIDIY